MNSPGNRKEIIQVEVNQKEKVGHPPLNHQHPPPPPPPSAAPSQSATPASKRWNILRAARVVTGKLPSITISENRVNEHVQNQMMSNHERLAAKVGEGVPGDEEYDYDWVEHNGYWKQIPRKIPP